MSFPVEQIIPITTRISPAGLGTANFASAMLFAKNSELPSSFTKDTVRTYYSTSSLAADFAPTTETYKAGAKFLGSTPAVPKLTVWATADDDADIKATLTKAFDKHYWYWTLVTKDVLATEANVLLIASWCEENSVMFPNSQTGEAVVKIRNPDASDDICSQLNTLGYRHAFTVAHATDPYAAYALIKHSASVNYSADNSTIDTEFKKSPGVAAEDLSDTEQNAMVAKRCAFYSVLDLQGSADSGRWLQTWSHSTYGESISDIVDLDAFVNSLRVELYNTIVNQTTKLPQTPVGQEALIGAAKRVGKQYIRNRYLGPRKYTSPDTGLEAYTDGFEVLTKATDILDLSDSDRAARKSAPINMRVFKAGSIRICDVTVDVY
ncbi:TPA: DUF3383 family protein [Escherichia coli]